MEMNVEKPEVMSILRQRSPVEPTTDYDRSKAPGECGIQHDKIKIQDAHVKLKRGCHGKCSIHQEEHSFHNKLDLNIRTK